MIVPLATAPPSFFSYLETLQKSFHQRGKRSHYHSHHLRNITGLGALCQEQETKPNMYFLL